MLTKKIDIRLNADVICDWLFPVNFRVKLLLHKIPISTSHTERGRSSLVLLAHLVLLIEMGPSALLQPFKENIFFPLKGYQ